MVYSKSLFSLGRGSPDFSPGVLAPVQNTIRSCPRGHCPKPHTVSSSLLLDFLHFRGVASEPDLPDLEPPIFSRPGELRIFYPDSRVCTDVVRKVFF